MRCERGLAAGWACILQLELGLSATNVFTAHGHPSGRCPLIANSGIAASRLPWALMAAVAAIGQRHVLQQAAIGHCGALPLCAATAPNSAMRGHVTSGTAAGGPVAAMPACTNG